MAKTLKSLEKYIGMDNIAEEFYTPDLPASDEMNKLTEIGNLVCSTAQTDKDSRSEYEKNMEEAFDLVKNDFKVKNSPWRNAANIQYPMIIGACIQFNARTLPEIIKNDSVVEVRNMKPDPNVAIEENLPPNLPPQAEQQIPQMPASIDDDRAQRLSDHMSYQLLGQSKHWFSDTDTMLMALPMLGTVFRKSFFNPMTKQPDTQLCMPENVIINDAVSSLEDAMRITHVIPMTANEMKEYMNAGLFLEYPIEELNQSVTDLKIQVMDNDSKVASIQSESFTVNEDKKQEVYDEIHNIYEQHRYLDLDGDGYQEPYIVSVHKHSQKVLRIVARYDEDSFDFNGNKFIKINPKHYFTVYRLLKKPDGSFYGMGLGELLLKINSTTNSILNNLIDAGTLANRQCGFIGDDLRINSGDLRFEPGEWKKAKKGMGNIQDSIVPLPIKEPSQTLFALLQFLIGSAKEITSISDVMQGEMPPPTTPAATTLALIEQGQKVYGAILYRIYESLKEEFRKLYDINKKYLTEEQRYQSALRSGIVKPDDYKDDNYGIFPVADPQLSSSAQRMLQAQAVMQLIQYQPYINIPEVLKNYMQALKIKDVKQILIENPPPPQPSADDQLKIAQAEETQAKSRQILSSIGIDLLSKENEHHKNLIENNKVQAESAYFGGKLGTERVDSTVKLAQANIALGEHEMDIAKQEEAQLVGKTEAATYPVSGEMQAQAQEQQVQQTQAEAGQAIQPQTGGQPPEIPPGLFPGGSAPQQ